VAASGIIETLGVVTDISLGFFASFVVDLTGSIFGVEEKPSMARLSQTFPARLIGNLRLPTKRKNSEKTAPKTTKTGQIYTECPSTSQ